MYRDLTLKDEELGKEYINELLEIVKIRKNRRLLYFDSFLQETPQDLLVLVKSKIKRYEITKDKKVQIDSLRDCVNYMIFLLIALQQKEVNKRDDKNESEISTSKNNS